MNVVPRVIRAFRFSKARQINIHKILMRRGIQNMSVHDVYRENRHIVNGSKELRKNGWYLKRQGANHEVWENGLGQSDYLPRHSDINEFTAKSIIKKSKTYPGKGAKK